MKQDEIVEHYEKVHAEMLSHIKWLSTGRVSFYEMNDGKRQDITQKAIVEAQARADSLATVIEAHKKLALRSG